jgi:DNA cross-link repair 1C protein
MLRAAISGRGLALNLDVSSFSENLSTTIQSMAEAILKKPANVPMKQPYLEGQGSDQLPRTIRFPYSRHSSYAELCHLASIFTPKDIWPCTVDVDQWLREDITIQSLFGHVCSATAFSHDRKMEEIRAKTETLHDTESEAHETQQTNSSHEASHALHFPTPMETRNPEIPSPIFDEVSASTAITAPQHHVLPEGSVPEAADKMVESSRDAEPHIHSHKRGYNEFSQAMDDEDAGDSQQTDHSIVSFLSSRHSASRWKAYYEALGGGADEADWQPSQLISTDGGHSVAEEEL